MTGLFIFLGVVFIVAAIVTVVLFNVAMQNAMKAVPEQYRKVRATGLIWLNLIPVSPLNSLWTWIYGVLACEGMNDAYGKEIAPRKIGFALITINVVTFLVGIAFQGMSYLTGNYNFLDTEYRPPSGGEVVGGIIIGVLGLASFVLFVIFWIQLRKATNIMRSNASYSNLKKETGEDILDSHLS